MKHSQLCYSNSRVPNKNCRVLDKDVEAEAVEAEAEAEARKFYRFRFHIGGKNGGRNEIGSAILRRRANSGA